MSSREMTATQSASALLTRLPLELRLTIYELCILAFINPDSNPPQREPTYKAVQLFGTPDVSGSGRPHPLIFTCKAIAREMANVANRYLLVQFDADHRVPVSYPSRAKSTYFGYKWGFLAARHYPEKVRHVSLHWLVDDERETYDIVYIPSSEYPEQPQNIGELLRREAPNVETIDVKLVVQNQTLVRDIWIGQSGIWAEMESHMESLVEFCNNGGQVGTISFTGMFRKESLDALSLKVKKVRILRGKVMHVGNKRVLSQSNVATAGSEPVELC